MILSRQQLDNIKTESYNKGYTDGRKTNVLQEEASLRAQRHELDVRVRAMEGSIVLAKALVEQLTLAGVPQWANPRK